LQTRLFGVSTILFDLSQETQAAYRREAAVSRCPHFTDQKFLRLSEHLPGIPMGTSDAYYSSN
jgi:hypothetical protein